MRPPPGAVPWQYFSKSALHAVRCSAVRVWAESGSDKSDRERENDETWPGHGISG